MMMLLWIRSLILLMVIPTLSENIYMTGQYVTRDVLTNVFKLVEFEVLRKHDQKTLRFFDPRKRS